MRSTIDCAKWSIKTQFRALKIVTFSSWIKCHVNKIFFTICLISIAVFAVFKIRTIFKNLSNLKNIIANLNSFVESIDKYNDDVRIKHCSKYIWIIIINFFNFVNFFWTNYLISSVRKSNNLIQKNVKQNFFWQRNYSFECRCVCFEHSCSYLATCNKMKK